jgi:hypothetical protein
MLVPGGSKRHTAARETSLDRGQRMLHGLPRLSERKVGMSRALLALALGLALGSPPLQSWAAGLVEVVLAAAEGTDAGGRFDPDGGANTNVGSIFDPNGGADTDAGNGFDPNG